MQLATFIELAREEILAESAAYAKSMLTLGDADDAVLRNHLPKVLEAISADLRTPQSRTEAIEKSRGHAPAPDHETAAQAHGLLRARSGLRIEQVVAEYRALRSCVLRLWSEAHPPHPDAVQDLCRFNEAIDQALAESVRVHAAEVERWQQLFLGVMGHDLRAPLNAIALTTEIISLGAQQELASRAMILKRSVRRMTSLLDSLLEYNRVGLGGGMVIEKRLVDVETICREELDVQRAGLPGAKIELTVQGDTRGEFDVSRIHEALGNLVTNAVKHGVDSEPVLVSLEGVEGVVRLSVENTVAQAIHPDEVQPLFEPLHRGGGVREGSDRTHLGLGLFIVRQIARAHGGDVNGHCSSNKVRFTIVLPKVPA